VDDTKIKRYLWENVAALMKKHWNEENVTRLAREAKIGGSASRIKEQETSVGLGVVFKVAKLFKVEPFALLAPPELRNVLSDDNLLKIARIYGQTDDEGRRVMTTAARIAEARSDVGSAGVGKSGKAHN
jgi:hypothetical protein